MEKAQTIEEIAESCFEESDISDGDEGVFDIHAHKQPLDAGDDSTGEQENNSDEKSREEQEDKKPESTEQTQQQTQTQQQQQPQQKEWEQPRQSQDIQQQQQQQKPQPEKEEIPDLNRDEFTLLAEHDESDGTNFVKQYLLRKMESRDLNEYELQKLKDIDGSDDKSDLYGKYIESKTERRIMSKLDPVISSHTREEQEKAQKEIADREKAIEDSNKNEFGDELIELKKSVSDAKFIEKVLTGNPMADIIVREWRNGSQAMSHKLLLREAKSYLSKQTETKKQRSFPADIGAGDTQRRVDKADSIEDAFEIADRENS